MIRVFCDKGQFDIEADEAVPDMTNNLVLKLANDIVAIFRCECWSYFQVLEE